MKIKAKEITRKNTFLSHMILSTFNEEALNTIETPSNQETEYNICLTFNGVELDIRKFCERLENSWENAVKKAVQPEANKLFEEMKHTFKSKNSKNAQLNKIKEQLQKANNQLKNIEEHIKDIE